MSITKRNQFITFRILLVVFQLIVYSAPICSVHLSQTAAFSDVDAFIHRDIRDKKMAGAVVLVANDTNIVYFKAVGYADILEKKKMEKNSIFRIYSMTKPISSVAVMMLVERGFITLEDPIEKYIPQLKGLKVLHGHEKTTIDKSITIRDLLRHTAGFTYGMLGNTNTEVDKLYNKKHPLYVASDGEFINRLSRLPLLHQPGTKYHYSIATDVLGILVEKVSGEKLSDFFRKNIFIPLGMKDTEFFVPNSKIDRFCTLYTQELKAKESYRNSSLYAENNVFRRESAGGGLVSTASDYLKFCQMLLNKGTYKGKKILTEATVKAMTTNQLRGNDCVYRGVGFGFGFSVQLEECLQYGHIGDYGWSGRANTHFWISPKDNSIVIILSQTEPFSNELLKLKPMINKSGSITNRLGDDRKTNGAYAH